MASCAQYGHSYFVLRNIRLRTTFASCDTSYTNVKLAICEYYEHVLCEYTDNELKAICDVALKAKPYCDSSIINRYKEIQIHGDVKFSRDIAKVVVGIQDDNPEVRARAKEFGSKFNCDVEFVKDLKPESKT